MKGDYWILLDTETTGFAAPIYVVEIAAQKMQGWEPFGEPFRRLVNQSQDIPPEASRVHGYTREILERDGEPAHAVYAAFAEYVAALPLVAYNLEYDLDKVLRPEWLRLNISPIGQDGFCALRLAQRLLDPVPAGNCKLQTLRQYYRMPERGAHTGLGDVMTVADLFTNVLRPIAEQRGLETWGKLVNFTREEWYPSRLSFGKHKGKSFLDARHNPTIRKWLEWLAGSSSSKSASMGRWYLRELKNASARGGDALEVVTVAEDVPLEKIRHGGIIIYVHPDLQRLRSLVAASRARLAELEAAYTSGKSQVAALQARLFKKLRPHFEERDRLRLLVSYRRSFLDTLLSQGEEEAEKVRQEHQQADARSKREYNDTQEAMDARRVLSPQDESELKNLWRNLVKLFHPDRFADDPEKMEAYTRLTAAINTAKDAGDLETLRQIADDPAGYMLRHGWAAIDFGDTDELEQFEKLFRSLENEIIAALEAINTLKDSPDYELFQIIEKEPEVLEQVLQRQIMGIDEEVDRLKSEAEKLGNEIEELSVGNTPPQM